MNLMNLFFIIFKEDTKLEVGKGGIWKKLWEEVGMFKTHFGQNSQELIKCKILLFLWGQEYAREYKFAGKWMRFEIPKSTGTWTFSFLIVSLKLAYL